jgi:hypothetical protein
MEGLLCFAENTTKRNIYLEILELSAFLQIDDRKQKETELVFH